MLLCGTTDGGFAPWTRRRLPRTRYRRQAVTRRGGRGGDLLDRLVAAGRERERDRETAASRSSAKRTVSSDTGAARTAATRSMSWLTKRRSSVWGAVAARRPSSMAENRMAVKRRCNRVASSASSGSTSARQRWMLSRDSRDGSESLFATGPFIKKGLISRESGPPPGAPRLVV